MQWDGSCTCSSCSKLYAGIIDNSWVAVYHATFFLSFEVWNLANGEDVEETKKQVEKYKKDNENLIRKNNFKLVSLTNFFSPTFNLIHLLTIRSSRPAVFTRDLYSLPASHTTYP